MAACLAVAAALAAPYVPAAGLAGAEAGTAPAAALAVADPVIAAAGDIACAPGTAQTATKCHQAETANLLAQGNYAAVLPVGDEQYDCGQLSAFRTVYDKTWGAFNAKAFPVVGDNEYAGAGCSTPGASGYYTYFGGRASPDQPTCTTACRGYYSYDIGAWHLIALNSDCGQAGVGGCGATNPMGTWLKNDLAAHASTSCTLAYWHRPYWANGSVSAKFKPLVQLLYDGGVELLLVGHNHLYTRFAPQNPSGVADAQGVREFVLGVGGVNHAVFKTPVLPNIQARDNTTFGLLALTLHPNSYDFAFIKDGTSGAFTDSGTGVACHGGGTPAPQAPTAVTVAATNVTATAATLNGTVNPRGSATTYQFDYGTTTSYGSSTPVTAAGSGTTDVAASATLSGLTPGTTYHYRLSASNVVGPANGADATFTASDGTGTCTPGFLAATDTADTFVYAGSPSATFGGATELKANNVGDIANERTMFLSFDTPSLPAGCTATSATLTMVTGQSGIAKQQSIDLHAQDAATWDEATLSWANQPARGVDVATGLTFTLQTAGQLQTFALPAGSWLNPGATTSVSITSPTAAAKLFASKENSGSAAPQLRIDYS